MFTQNYFFHKFISYSPDCLIGRFLLVLRMYDYNMFIKYFFINKLQHARSIDRVFFDIISNYKNILGERDAKENIDLANVYICL